MDSNPPGSYILGISQAKILEWVAISSSRGSFRPRDRTCISFTGRQILYHWATRVTPFLSLPSPVLISKATFLDKGDDFPISLRCSCSIWLHLKSVWLHLKLMGKSSPFAPVLFTVITGNQSLAVRKWLQVRRTWDLKYSRRFCVCYKIVYSDGWVWRGKIEEAWGELAVFFTAELSRK